jgi:hypothetical protein
MNTTNPRLNASGCPDPTAFAALSAVSRAERRKSRSFRPLVYVCSPYAGDVSGNTGRARKYCRFVVRQGAIPFAPHLLYPQFMSDKVPAERELALLFGKIWLSRMDEVWVFGEHVSEGMKAEIAKTHAKRIPLKFFTADCEVRRSE